MGRRWVREKGLDGWMGTVTDSRDGVLMDVEWDFPAHHNEKVLVMSRDVVDGFTCK